jgi:integrase
LPLAADRPFADEPVGGKHRVIGAMRALMFTGARPSEVLTLKRQHVDFERRLLMLADSRTGEKLVLASLPRLEGQVCRGVSSG